MQPPRLARWLASVFVPPQEREFLLGDLDEQFAATAAAAGPSQARRRYWRQALGAAWRLRVRRRGRRFPAGSPGSPRFGGRRVPMANLLHDVRLGIRTALRSPGYTMVSVATLALAIGANTLLFSIASPLLIRPLPIDNPDRLGWIEMNHRERNITRGEASLAEYLEWRGELSSFSELAAWSRRPATLIGDGDAEAIVVSRVTTNLVQVWGLEPQLGRLFQPGEDEPGREPVAVLSHRYWREAFHGDPGVLGRLVLIDSHSTTVVGVMEPEIEIGSVSEIDVWLPQPLDPSAPRDLRTVTTIGILAPGSTLESANAELASVFANQRREHPEATQGWSPRIISTTAALASEDSWVVLALLGVVVFFVLLIACANLTNLTLARLLARRRDVMVRVAMGASRWRVVRPLLVEAGLLSVAGALAGLGLAYGGLRVVNAVAYESYFRQVSIDGYVLAFTALLAGLTPLLIALGPALWTGRSIAAGAGPGARVTGLRGARRGRNVLVGAQVALALALLVVSALAVQSMYFLQQTDLGFDPARMLIWNFELPADRYGDRDRQAQFARALLADLRALPGAEAVAVASHLPVFESQVVRTLVGTDRDSAVEGEQPWAQWYAVTPGFFEAAGIEVLVGRRFEDRDDDVGQAVAMVSRMAAERYFDSANDAVGRTIALRGADLAERRVTIVGVVSETRDTSVTATHPQVYVPLDQWPEPTLTAVVRATGDPQGLAPDARAVMRALDPLVAVRNLKTLPQVIREELSSTAILNGLFVSFAALALALAAAGLFGVISYSVGQRAGEIGVRLALGASPGGIGRMVVFEGLRITAAGVAIGLVLAAFLARTGASIMYGVTPTDLPTFAGAIGVVVAVAVVASWTPALRAMRVDPARTLRAE